MLKPPDAEKLSLQSWRERAPQEYGFDGTTRLLSLLLETTGFGDEAGRSDLTRAATRDIAGVMAVADRLGKAGGDLTYSWLSLAALLGDEAACAQIAAELVRQSARRRAFGRRREARQLSTLAERWIESLVAELSAAFGEQRHTLAKRILANCPSAIAKAIDHNPAAPPSSAVSLVVLPRGIPNMKNDRDDKMLIEAWKSLTTALPCAPGVPAHVMKTVLTLEFPWMEEIIATIAGELRFREVIGLAFFHLRPLLLVGPPGCGKTAFARRIAELSGVAFGELSAAGSSDNRLLAGTARGWGTAQPGFVLQLIRRSQVANPVILIDELDKTRADGRNGDIRQTLLSLLEPVTARAWPDECLCSPADLSAVSWLFTANDVGPLKGPLLTRLRVVSVPLPRREHCDAIFEGVKRDIERQWGLGAGRLPSLLPAIEKRLRQACQQGISLRRLRCAYERALQLTEISWRGPLH